MGSNSDAYIVNPDGSISMTISAKGIDDVLRAFIRVAANKSGKTTAYSAQKKAIKYLKSHSDCAFPETYVQDLELREFPIEFKKAELGKKYYTLVWLSSTLWISIIGIFAYYWLYKGFKEVKTQFDKLNAGCTQATTNFSEC